MNEWVEVDGRTNEWKRQKSMRDSSDILVVNRFETGFNACVSEVNVE
ncbi:hypothetical protein [Alkalihalophilus pseudofirmus]|nr:hypothetical protein [Alkalihalophilus pseudofirmus]